MSSCSQQKRMARSQSVELKGAGSAGPGAVAECPEQELSETFQPTGEMIATYSKRVTLSELTLEAYMEVFGLLTKGFGNLVQPNLDARQFTVSDLLRVNHWHFTFRSSLSDNSCETHQHCFYFMWTTMFPFLVIISIAHLLLFSNI